MKFRRPIGLKSENVIGDCLLGERVRKKAVVALSSLPELKKCETALITSGPIISQQWVKNISEKPSSPGELDLLRLKTAFLILAIEGSATKISFC